jgi:hypothetical protein
METLDRMGRALARTVSHLEVSETLQ